MKTIMLCIMMLGVMLILVGCIVMTFTKTPLYLIGVVAIVFIFKKLDKYLRRVA